MSNPIIPTRKIFSLWWPLAASSLLMSAEMPFVNSAIARTPNPEVALAGFGLAMNLAIVTEGPILMLIGTTTALAINRPAFKLIERFTIHLGIFVTVLNFVLAFTPVYDLVLRQVMGVPAPVAEACLPALRILLLWPAPIGWRRFHQGVLIRMRRTSLVSVGTILRLVITTLLTLVVFYVLYWPGQWAGAAAVVVAVLSEALFISIVARRLSANALSDEVKGQSLTYLQLFHFHAPLAMMSLMSITAQPIVSTGLARAPFPTESLASWPTVWGLTMIICGFCQPVQETTIALVENHRSLGAVRRFGLLIGIGASALLALIALTPLADFYFGRMIGLSPRLLPFAHSAVWLMMDYPLLMAVEAMLRGVLVKQGRTKDVRLAMGVYLVVLGAALVIGITAGWGTGVQVAAVALHLAILSEIALLAWQAMTVVRTLRHVAATT